MIALFFFAIVASASNIKFLFRQSECLSGTFNDKNGSPLVLVVNQANGASCPVRTQGNLYQNAANGVDIYNPNDDYEYLPIVSSPPVGNLFENYTDFMTVEMWVRPNARDQNINRRYVALLEIGNISSEALCVTGPFGPSLQIYTDGRYLGLCVGTVDDYGYWFYSSNTIAAFAAFTDPVSNPQLMYIAVQVNVSDITNPKATLYYGLKNGNLVQIAMGCYIFGGNAHSSSMRFKSSDSLHLGSINLGNEQWQIWNYAGEFRYLSFTNTYLSNATINSNFQAGVLDSNPVSKNISFIV